MLTEGLDISGDYILPGIIVTKDNAQAMLKLADDMANDTANFPFDKPLDEIIKDYLGK